MKFMTLPSPGRRAKRIVVLLTTKKKKRSRSKIYGIHLGTLTHPSLILGVTQSPIQQQINNAVSAVVKHKLAATIWQEIERLMKHAQKIWFAHTLQSVRFFMILGVGEPWYNWSVNSLSFCRTVNRCFQLSLFKNWWKFIWCISTAQNSFRIFFFFC